MIAAVRKFGRLSGNSTGIELRAFPTGHTISVTPERRRSGAKPCTAKRSGGGATSTFNLLKRALFHNALTQQKGEQTAQSCANASLQQLSVQTALYPAQFYRAYNELLLVAVVVKLDVAPV
jgi:hypothetical protein